jgi:hypothetical protein
MKPEVDQILNLSAGQLLAATVPLLPNSYSQGSTSVLAFMMMFSAQEYERAAEIRVRENADMRALFEELSPLVADANLKLELESSARTKDESLLISVLDRNNAELRELLIQLQTYLEDQNSDAARAGVKRIWDVLKKAAERRFLKPPGA